MEMETHNEIRAIIITVTIFGFRTNFCFQRVQYESA